MSSEKLKRLPRPDSAPISPLRGRRDSTGKHVVWGLVPPSGDESCRWASWDGRWIALTLGSGDEFGSVILTSSDSRREAVSTYEGALALAKKWRDEWNH
jgi:hypothetical protein